MKLARRTAIIVVLVGASLLGASATGQAYDFANICPPQPAPTWAGSAETWVAVRSVVRH